MVGETQSFSVLSIFLFVFGMALIRDSVLRIHSGLLSSTRIGFKIRADLSELSRLFRALSFEQCPRPCVNKSASGLGMLSVGIRVILIPSYGESRMGDP